MIHSLARDDVHCPFRACDHQHVEGRSKVARVYSNTMSVSIMDIRGAEAVTHMKRTDSCAYRLLHISLKTLHHDSRPTNARVSHHYYLFPSTLSTKFFPTLYTNACHSTYLPSQLYSLLPYSRTDIRSSCSLDTQSSGTDGIDSGRCGSRLSLQVAS